MVTGWAPFRACSYRPRAAMNADHPRLRGENNAAPLGSGSVPSPLYALHYAANA